MDDTQHSRTSDAAATRKRRSSILKLQRAPRAPFSELEFNVATPTDTAKSRRVSFSRRTGVAEFVTNEATTTWKNFYEEHNKTLESSGNDSVVNPPRGTVGHIGKRIFDEQFQEVVAVDFVSTLDDGSLPVRNIETSLNTVNFAEQFASLENTGDDRKLTAPHQNFELSAFTDHQSKVFGDDLAISCMGELSDRISVNFSTVQPIGEVKDDLDEIQRDLQSAQSYMVCQGPSVICTGAFRDSKDLSEYIEVDLNMTNAAIRNESDMSMTDTIQSPKVENVAKISASAEKKSSLNKDWVADKENILVNPYVAPKESANFAINEEPDKVLIFDGKRLTIQTEKDKTANYRKTLLPNVASEPTPQRKTIVLNVNDDLPNFVDASMSQSMPKNLDVSDHTIRDGGMSMTQPLGSKVGVNEKRRTILYENDTGNISITQALPGTIVKPDFEKRRAIVYERNSTNISVTQAVSSNIILADKESLPEKRKSFTKEKSIVFDNDAGNISITQPVPSNIISSSQCNAIPDTTRTIVFKTDSGDISVTQAISSNIISSKKSDTSEKRKTIVYEDDAGNISITQAIPSNIILPDNEEMLLEEKTVVYDNDLADISITQALPANFIITDKESMRERRKTIVYEDDAGNISITQAVPSNILLARDPSMSKKRETIVFETDSGDISVTEMIPSNVILSEQRKAKSGSANISVTQAVLSELILPEKSSEAVPSNMISSEKRKAMVRKSGSIDASVTKVVPSNIILSEKRKSIVHKSGSVDMSVMQVIPSNLLLSENIKTIVNECGSTDMSVTQAVPSNQILIEGRHSILGETGSANMLVTQTVPSNQILIGERKSIVHENFPANMPVLQSVSSNQILPERKNTVVYDSGSADMSVTQAVPSIMPVKRKTVVFDSDSAEITMTQNFSNIIMPDNVDLLSEKRKTIVHEDSGGNISITRTIPENLDAMDDKTRTIVFETNSGNISVTQSIPSTAILPEKKQTNIFQSNSSEISGTSEFSAIITESEKPHIKKNILTTDSKTMSTASYSTLLPVEGQESNVADLSMTESLDANVKKLEEANKENRHIPYSEHTPFKNLEEPVKGRNSIFIKDVGNMSITKPIPTNIISIEKDLLEKSKLNSTLNYKHLNEFDETANLQHGVLVYQADTEKSAMPKSRTNDHNDPIVAPINSSFETMMAPSASKQNVIKSSKEDIQTASLTSAGLTDCGMSGTDEACKRSEQDVSNIMIPSATSNKTIDSDIISTEDKSVLHKQNNVKSASATSHTTIDSHTSKIDRTARKPVLHDGDIMKPGSETSARTLDSDTCRVEQKSKKSILDDLLDMSHASMSDGMDDKNVMVQLPSDDSQGSPAQPGTDNTSKNSLFFITKDSEDEGHSSDKLLSNQSYLPLEYKKEDNSGIVSDLQNKLSKLKPKVKLKSTNRHFESIKSSDIDKNETKSETKNVTMNGPNNETKTETKNEIKNETMDKSNINGYICFKEADSTKDLIEILSNFTDKEEEENPIEPIKVSSEMSVDDKADIPVLKRLSFVPARQSIVPSREDFLSNISMAQAVLQKSRVDIDDDETIDDMSGTITEDKGTQAKKTVRMSKEVVKKLHFEDTSFSDMSNKSEMVSPLKKTAFGEESYMKENNPKAYVIPSYLQDISENLKQLMSDLVKPTADVMPFESVGVDSRLNKAPSTCSLQVQANLVTSSQIDLETDPSTLNEEAVSQSRDGADIKSQIVDVTKKTLQSALKTVTTRFSSESNAEMETVHSQSSPYKQPTRERVLVFDQNNPLNNVLFRPIDYSEAHGYNPGKSNETLVASDNSGNSASTKVTFKENDVQYVTDLTRVTTDYRVAEMPIPYSSKPSDENSQKMSEVSSVTFKMSKRESIDRSINTSLDLKDTEVNTYIVMKGNNELLDTSSSLTLVDDALVQDHFDVEYADVQSQPETFVEKKISPVRIIYKIEEDASNQNKDSDLTSNDEEYQEAVKDVTITKAKKRNYSPSKQRKHKHCTLSNLDVTPKPTKKMQRLSDRPLSAQVAQSIILRSSPGTQSKYESDKEKSDFDHSPERRRKVEVKSPKSHSKSSRKSKSKKPGTTITVQQLITEYHIETQMAKPIRSEILEALNTEAEIALRNFSPQSRSESASSYASSNCHSDVEEARSVTTSDSQSTCSHVKGVMMDWQPELLNEPSSKNLVTECESGVNVVAKIDMLPFMGSRDCEWESRGSDLWSFRLLHGRLRLSVRLAHRHENASRSRVRADTPVIDTKIETLHHDKQSPVAVVCVRLASEAMRGVAGRGAARAGDVPALLRRCAGVARVALRWGRAVHDARARLAFSLSPTGYLALKVANIPLRSVWEVTMRLEMIVDDAREIPWPGVSNVRVTPIVSDVHVTADEVRRVLAPLRRDWGHAPRAIWKIFKYLKNKTVDDDLLLGL